MKRKSRLRALFSTFLSAALVLSTVPGLVTPAQAERHDLMPLHQQDPQDKTFAAPRTQPVELTEHRTARSKRMLNPDGTMTETVYLEPIHYRDDKGKWQKIDSALVPKGKGKHGNKANKFAVELPDSAEAAPVTYTEADGTVSFRPLFVKPSKAKTKGSTLDYVDAAKDTDITYNVLPKGLKETVVIKSPHAPNTFTYELSVANLDYDMQKDGSISFFKKGDAKKATRFELAAPLLLDNKQQAGRAYYRVRREQGKTLLDLVVDENWMHAPERAFPVLLDPTIVTKDAPKVEDTFVSKLNGDYNFAIYSHNYIGESVNFGTTRTLTYFDLPSLPSGSTITSAYLNVTNTNVYVTTQAPVVQAYRINSDWSTTGVTWNNQPAVGAIEGTYTAANTTFPYRWNIPITGLVQGWYNGTVNNYGVGLKFSDETRVVREILATDSPSDVANHPALTINYAVDGLGEQPFWTYDGPVNMANRNLVYTARDIDFPGRRVQLTAQRTYNSRSTSTGIFGYGWTSPLDMRLTVATNGNARLVDGTGTVHYFVLQPDGSYASPPGLFWDLSVSGTTATVTTPDNTRYVFTSGKPTQIKDASNSTLTIGYNTAGLPSTIKDDAGNTVTLEYYASSTRVYKITDPAGRSYFYGFDSQLNLFKVTDPENRVVLYRYDSDHNLVAVVAPNTVPTYYEYSEDDRLVAINPSNGVSNSNFEVDSDGDGLPDHFSYNGGYPGVSIVGDTTPSTNPVNAGGKSIRIDSSNAFTAPYTVFVSDPVQIPGNATITLSAYIKAAQTSGSQFTIVSALAYDANNVSLGEIGRIQREGPIANWERVSQTVTTPAGTARVHFKVGASNGTGVGSSFFDAVQLEESSTLNPFTSGSQFTASLANQLSARYDGEGQKRLYTYNDMQNITKVQQDPAGLNATETYGWSTTLPNAMTSQKNARGYTWSFNQDPNTGNLLKVTNPKGTTQQFSWDGKSNLTRFTDQQGSAYNLTYDANSNNLTTRDPYFTSTAQQHDASGNVLKQTIPLGWADNLILNTSFEEAVQANGVPLRWSYSVGQSGMWGIASDAVFGKNSLRISANAANALNHTVILSDPVTIDPGADYVLSGYFKQTKASGTQKTVLSAYAYNSADTYLGEVGRMSLEQEADWQRWSSVIQPGEFPAGTAKLRFKAAALNEGGSGNSYIDAVSLQKNPVETAYNLTDNSSFERGASWPDNWTQPANSAWETAVTYAGGRSVSIANLTYWNGIVYKELIPYDKSLDYNLTAYVKTDNLSAGVAHIKIEYFDAAKTLIGQTGSPYLSGTKDWQRLSAELLANGAPANTVYIRPALMTGNATGKVYFDNVRMQIGRVTTTYGYNATNTWATSRTDALGRKTSYEHDAAGNVIKQTSPKGSITESFYDKLNQLQWTKSPGNDLQVNQEYDASGNLRYLKHTDLTTSKVYATELRYNRWDQISSILDPRSRETKYVYTPSGNRSILTTPTGNKINYKYDALDRLNKVYFNDVERYRYFYDENDNLKRVEDLSQNRAWDATYDELDRLKTWSDGLATITYDDIDPADNVKQQTLKVGLTTKVHKQFFNKVYQPTSLTDADGRYSEFLFNENKQLAMLRSGNGVAQRIAYDPVGHIKTVKNQTANGIVLSGYDYDYDDDGNVEKITYPDGASRSFTYTVREQLKTEQLPNGRTVTYTYDPLGNLKNRLETQGTTTVSNTSYTYSDANELLTAGGTAIAHDADGRMTSNGTYDFQWDAAGRLTQVSRVGNATPFAVYRYDQKGRRIYQSVNGVETYLLYDGKSNRVLAELDKNKALSKYYTWSPMGQLLSITADDPRDTATTHATFYTVRNGHGDIVALTDVNGATVATYEYDAWGNPTSAVDAMGAINPYRYANYRYDEATGLYYLNARYYDPKLYRFLTPDPTLFSPDYTYAANNPLVYEEPDGEWIFDVAFLVYDVVSFVRQPSWSGAAWIALDVVSTAIPFGSLSTVAHAAKAINRASHVAEAARYVGRADHIASTSRRVSEIGSKTNFVPRGVGKGKGGGSVGGGGGGGVQGAGEGIIYLRTNVLTGAKYVGKAKSQTRYERRQYEHRYKARKKGIEAEYEFEIIGRANPGDELKVLEQKMINKYGGIGGGTLENEKNAIDRKFWDKFGIEEDD